MYIQQQLLLTQEPEQLVGDSWSEVPWDLSQLHREDITLETAFGKVTEIDGVSTRVASSLTGADYLFYEMVCFTISQNGEPVNSWRGLGQGFSVNTKQYVTMPLATQKLSLLQPLTTLFQCQELPKRQRYAKLHSSQHVEDMDCATVTSPEDKDLFLALL